MDNRQLVETLEGQLHSDQDHIVYAVLDGASVPNLLEMIDEHEPEYTCLFSGDLDPEVEQTAPYLVRLQANSEFNQYVIEHGWGRHWGIFSTVPQDQPFVAVRKHFRTFLRVRGPDGTLMLFRYYDPRVLRVYLPTCNEDEAEILFGPLTSYLMEDEDPSVMLRFSPEHVGAEGVRVPIGRRAK